MSIEMGAGMSPISKNGDPRNKSLSHKFFQKIGKPAPGWSKEMFSKRIENATRNLGAPTEVSSKDCSHLWIRDGESSLGPVMVSAWEPTPKELEILVKGGTIYLTICGNIHPMVSLMTENPFRE